MNIKRITFVEPLSITITFALEYVNFSRDARYSKVKFLPFQFKTNMLTDFAIMILPTPKQLSQNYPRKTVFYIHLYFGKRNTDSY